jgi:hypothetical protein
MVMNSSHAQQRLLLTDLQDHNAFFDSIVDMIPSKLYIAGNSGDDCNPKYHKGQNQESREARRAQKKASKRAKFDPALAESTVETKKRLEEERSNGAKVLLPLKGQPLRAEDKKAEAPNNNGSLPLDNKSRIEVLRAKLHAKIAEKGGQRPTDPSVVSKRAARRAEKQRRKEEAMKKKKMAQTKVDARGTNQAKYTISSDSKMVDPAQDLAKMDFGRLTGLNPATPTYKNNKALANLSGGKNLEKVLADAEQKRQKLEELKRSEKEEDKEKLAKMQWSDALKEASGERVKDDPAKLKNKLKRKAAKKAKSQKAWKSRMEQTQQKMDDRQKIRTHNLDKRKLGGKAGANLSRKKIVDEEDKTKGKGKDSSRRLSRPGFEGKKQGFLNEKKTQQ